MKRALTVLFLLSYACVSSAAGLPKKPKLIVAIVVDQFRYDYLLRFRQDYTAGLKRLLEQGAVFDDAHHIHNPTVTAVGHSTFLSGATPSLSGIVANEWYDRETKKTVTSVSDDDTKLVGGVPGVAGSSPRRMLVSTVGDEIKVQGQDSRVIGVSIKDRGAILTAGHMANAAYWFDPDSNHWVTSSYYMDALPEWVQGVNDAKPHMRSFGASWMALDAKPGDKPICSMVAGLEGVRYCGSLEASMWGNEMIEEFAEKALVAEKLGKHGGTDVLTVSFSSNDYVGHAVGPDSPAVRDISIRTDRLLGKLFELIDKEVGADNALVVMTADHGVAPVPEVNQGRKMPGGRLSDTAIGNAIQKALTDKYGPGKWLEATAGGMPYLSRSVAAKYKATDAAVAETAASAVRALPHIYRVYTAEELRTGRVSRDEISNAMSYGFFGRRSGDIYILLDPYYLTDATGTTHGTPYGYDSHVPVIFLGSGIKTGHYYQKITVNDVAPTLSAIAGTEPPSGAFGRVLQELWQ